MTDDDGRVPAEGAIEEKSVLFADIADSTALYESLGDDAGRRILSQCLTLMEDVARENGGRHEERIGDEILCTFDDPDTAVRAALQLQRHVVQGHATGELELPMRIRIGFEHGSITRTPDGLFGATIHTAARLVALAKSSQILTSKSTLERLSPENRRMERYFDSVVLKGIAGEQHIYELLWDSAATMVPSRRPRRLRETGVAAVEIRHGNETIRVCADLPAITIGRDPACTLQLASDAVSRLHARVVWNRGKVRVEDVSTNGTCIEPERAPRLHLHHDWAELTGDGLLRCGCIDPLEPATLVEYRCIAQ